jgi:nucleoside-diphosphate-sugar epimerase
LQVHGDGSQTRSYLYVSDLVDALVRVGTAPRADTEILNVGNPVELSVLELAETIRRLFAPGSSIRLVPGRPGDPQRRRPDITRIEAEYDWHPMVSLADGLKSTVEWFAEQFGDGRDRLPAQGAIPETSDVDHR